MQLRVVARVESPLHERGEGPLQGFEGSPECRIVFTPEYTDAASDLRAGDELYVLTWLHQADRSVRRVHPRGDPRTPLTGVFATRSPDRPNPVGLHRVTVLEVVPAGAACGDRGEDGTGEDGVCLVVRDLEAIDGTPVIDVKPVLPGGR